MKISLDWVNLFPSVHGKFSVSQDTDIRVERLNKLYAEVFKPELGTVKGVTAKLQLKGNATPVFQGPRLVPYALRFAVEEELKRVENDGVLKPVEASNWATLIICVPKTDGSVRICGEYKGKVNPSYSDGAVRYPNVGGDTTACIFIASGLGECKQSCTRRRDAIFPGYFFVRS